MNMTEQRLVRMWSATTFGGDWFDLNKTLWEISKVLEAEGMQDGAEQFSLLANVALQIAVDETRARKMRVAA
ncbi:MAG: hypothetical protein ACOY4U_00865 [Pseudomonadota bacterium]